MGPTILSLVERTSLSSSNTLSISMGLKQVSLVSQRVPYQVSLYPWPGSNRAQLHVSGDGHHGDRGTGEVPGPQSQSPGGCHSLPAPQSQDTHR